MNILKKFLRLIIYVCIILFCFTLIKCQQNKIQNQRNSKAVSIINEWQKNGKPVQTIKVKRRDFPQFSKFTIMSSQGDEYISYVTGQTAKELKIGQNVYGTMERRHLLGQITYVANEINFDKGLFKVKIKANEVSKTEHKNLIVFVHTHTDKNVLWIPIDAADFSKTDNKINFFVWTIKNNKAYKQQLTKSKVSATGIQIKEGLTEGTEIVLTGKTALHENDDVYIIGEISK